MFISFDVALTSPLMTCFVCHGDEVVVYLGLAHDRNRKSEEEWSHAGLPERKNLFRNRERRAVASVEPADEKGPRQMRGEMGTLRSVHPAHHSKNGWARRF